MLKYLVLLLVLVIVILIYLVIRRIRMNNNPTLREEITLVNKSEDDLIIRVLELLKFLTDESFFSDGKVSTLLKKHLRKGDKEIINYLKSNVNLQLISSHKSAEIFKYLIYNSVKENGFDFDFYNNFYCRTKSNSDPALVQRFLAYSTPKRSFTGINEILISPLIELEYLTDIETSLKKYAMINNLRSSTDGPLFLVVILKNLMKQEKIDGKPISYLFFLRYNLYRKVFFKENELIILTNEDKFNEEGFFVSMLIYKREKEASENYFNI